MIISKEQIAITDQQGNKTKKLVISYVGKDGQIKFLQYPIPTNQMFEWRYTTRQYADPIWKSWDGKFIRKNPCDTLNDYRIQELMCGFGSAVDPVYENNIPETYYIDIEVDVREDGFPEAETAYNPVNTIAITRYPNTCVFSRRELTQQQIDSIQKRINEYHPLLKNYKFEFRYFQTEEQMMMSFWQFVADKPCLTGWNFTGYDWPYLTNRSDQLGISWQWISPTGKADTVKNQQGVKFKLPRHKIVFDYMEVYKQWDKTIAVKESNKLDWVAENVLGFKKVEHSEGFADFYRNHFEDYVFYNAVDSIIVEQIHNKLRTSDIWFMLASELRTELNDSFGTIKPVETVMSWFIYKDRKVVLKRKGEVTKESYEGAFVWPTIPGTFKYVGALDFMSLYPHILMQFLISPEKFKFKDKTGNYIPNKDEIKTVSGAVFAKDENGLFPNILHEYFAKRKQAKKNKKQVSQEAEDLKHILEQRINLL